MKIDAKLHGHYAKTTRVRSRFPGEGIKKIWYSRL